MFSLHTIPLQILVCTWRCDKRDHISHTLCGSDATPTHKAKILGLFLPLEVAKETSLLLMRHSRNPGAETAKPKISGAPASRAAWQHFRPCSIRPTEATRSLQQSCTVSLPAAAHPTAAGGDSSAIATSRGASPYSNDEPIRSPP